MIENTLRKREELRTMAEGVGAIRYDKDRVQTSPADHMSETMAKMLTLEEKLTNMIINYHNIVVRRIRMIERMNDARYVQLLSLRYIDGASFEEIACRMSYSWKHVIRLHGEALTAFGNQYADTIKDAVE